MDFFLVSHHFSPTWKRWIYGIKPPFFLVNHISRTRFLQPLFYTFLEKWLQIKCSSGYMCSVVCSPFRIKSFQHPSHSNRKNSQSVLLRQIFILSKKYSIRNYYYFFNSVSSQKFKSGKSDISWRHHKWSSPTLVRHILTWTFLLWHSLSSTYFCSTQLSFSQFSPGITQPQLSLIPNNFVTHTSALA